MPDNGDQADSLPDVLEMHILSGGVGASAELLAHTVLAQFPDADVPLVIHSHVHTEQEVVEAVAAVADSGGLLLHTMVNTELRQLTIAEAARRNVEAIDLFGPLIDKLTERLDASPMGQAGRFRKLYGQYFKRVEAIEFTIAHDDGQRTSELTEAEIVLMGVSRLGKTPLSIYLAMQGWKVANVPFVPGITLPEDLWKVDRRRIVGLMIEPPQLAMHRQWREKRLQVDLNGYVGQQKVAGELREANRFFVRHNITVVDVTDKPIETSGTEIIGVVTQQLNRDPVRTLGEQA